MDFPVTVGAFDTVWNGDPTIFWGDAFVAKLSLTGGNTPPAPPPIPAAPTLLAPANGANPAQPVGFDWSDVAGAASYTIQIDDSSTLHRAPGAHADGDVVVVPRGRPAVHEPVLAGARRQHGGHARRVLRDAERACPSPPRPPPR